MYVTKTRNARRYVKVARTIQNRTKQEEQGEHDENKKKKIETEKN